MVILAVLILLDFSPMIYQRIFGNGGTFVECYHYDISGDSLLRRFVMNDSNLDIQVTTKDQGDYTYVQVLEKNSKEFIHLWIRTSQEHWKGTEIIFYGISKSSDYNDSKIINRDYDYISRKLAIDKFERLVIDKLNKNGGL